MTTPQGPVPIRLEGPVQQRAVDPTDTINPGDMLKWVELTGKATPVTADTDFDHFCGVSEGQIPIAGNVDNVPGLEAFVPVQGGGEIKFFTTPTEVYKDGLAVKIGADAQTVALDGAGTKTVGFVNLPDGSSITGAAGVKVPVLIKRSWPPIPAV